MLFENNLEKLYPKRALEDLGLYRKQCRICKRFFWTFDKNRDICGDHENYSFIGNPVGKRLSYREVWEDFSRYMESKGYVPVKRYPVVARWRDDLDFVIASIADFQPWVTNGYIDPPAKKLVIPQFCLRFNDIENVGLTGRHYTGFVMIGQHAFVKPEEYDKDSYFLDLYSWFEKNRFPMEEFLFHEDKWEGGGNGGTSIEFFIRGLEVANQVYMQYKIIDGNWIELEKLKVLDMGMGQERIAWITNGTPTSYDVVFKNSLEFLRNEITNKFKDVDLDVLYKISKYSSQYDFTEKTIEDFNSYIKNILGKDFRREIELMRATYSILDHFRTLYIAISDGALPSNIGGNYNLRLIARRMFYFILKYFENSNVNSFLEKLILRLLEDWYEPELKNNIKEILEILNYELEKYIEVRKNAEKKLSSIKNLDSEAIFKLYTTEGITLEIIRDFFPDIKIDKKFYELLNKHKDISKGEKKKKELNLDLKNFKETYKAFYESWKKYYEIGKYIGKVENYLVFDKTVFYPTKGGQIHDTGYIFNLSEIRKFSKNIINQLDFPYYVKEVLINYLDGDLLDLELFNKYYSRVIDVIEVEKVILHKVDKELEIKENDEILQIIDKDRRYRIARHHTATHVLTGVLRSIYGKHIWQAGAEKDENEGRLDITHYKVPTYEEIIKIERLANEIVLKGLNIKKYYLTRNEAEKRYGFTIYQGGFIPETILRIVEIEDFDVEACSGTHLDNTLEIGLIKILSVEKIADGIIRFRFVSGDRIIEEFERREIVLNNIREKYKVGFEDIIKFMEKNLEEKEEYYKKINTLIEDYILSLIKDGKITGKINLKINDVLKYLIKHKNKIDYVELECIDGIISSEPIGKKVDKFYIKFLE